MTQMNQDRGLSKQALLYSGWDRAQEQLPNLGLSWEKLQDIFTRSGKAAADLGSCSSPYPVEARLRGIPVTPIDPRYGTGADLWRANVLKRFGSLAPDTQSIVHEAIAAVDQSRLSLSALELQKLPERHFSIITAHDTLPKHTRSLEFFLSQELPNMLRVAEHSVRLYPFSIHRENSQGELVESHALCRDPKALADTAAVAHQHGFELHILNNSCAVFTRTGGVDLSRSSF